MTPTEAHDLITKAYRQGRDGGVAKLTKKQRETLDILKTYGGFYVSFKDGDMKTYEALVKRGLVRVVETLEYGKKYELAEVQNV